MTVAEYEKKAQKYKELREAKESHKAKQLIIEHVERKSRNLVSERVHTLCVGEKTSL